MVHYMQFKLFGTHFYKAVREVDKFEAPIRFHLGIRAPTYIF